MKKFLTLALAFAMVTSLAACGTNSSTPAADSTKPDSSSSVNDLNPASEEDEFSQLENFTMTVGHSQPAGTPRYESLAAFAAEVNKKTNGHITVDVFGDGQLGTEKEMLEQVVSGTIQGMRGGQFDFSPRLLMFTLPFLANNRSEITALLSSDLAEKVCTEAEADTGTVIINLCDAGGFRQFSNNKHPIKTPSDLNGLKMRTNGMKTIDLTFDALGATTVSVPYADLYMNLKTGVADGQENPWVNVSGMKFYEVQKYFTEVNYQFHPDPFYVNAQWWDSLPQEFQTIVSDCATTMGSVNDELIDEKQSEAREIIENSGCEIYVPTEDELKSFNDAMQSVYQKCVNENILTQDELDELLSIVAKA